MPIPDVRTTDLHCPIDGCEFEGESRWLTERHLDIAHSPEERDGIDPHSPVETDPP